MKKEAIVFGCGSFFKEKYRYVKKKFNILFCIDNSVSESVYNEEFKMHIFPPEKIKETTDELILCMSRSDDKMRHQLLGMGVHEDRILLSNDALNIILDDFNNSDYEATLKAFKTLPLYPCDRVFGQTHGMAVDRFYIDSFIKNNGCLIRGNVIEVGALRYAKKYMDNIETFHILHKNGWGNNSIKGNLETGDGIPDGDVDCFICTQTLQYIFNLPEAIKNIWKMLKIGGTALITVPGIKLISIFDNENWEDLWSFTEVSLERLCRLCFSDVSVESHGNAKTAAAYLYGICQEDMDIKELEYKDFQYPFILTAVLKK